MVVAVSEVFPNLSPDAEFRLSIPEVTTDSKYRIHIPSQKRNLVFPIVTVEEAVGIVGTGKKDLGMVDLKIPWRPSDDFLEKPNELLPYVHVSDEVHLSKDNRAPFARFLERVKRKLPEFKAHNECADGVIGGLEDLLRAFGATAQELGFPHLTVRLFRTAGARDRIESLWHRDYPFSGPSSQLRFIATLHAVSIWFPGQQEVCNGGTALFPLELVPKSRERSLKDIYREIKAHLQDQGRGIQPLHSGNKRLNDIIDSWVESDFRGGPPPYVRPGIGTIFAGGSNGVFHRALRGGEEILYRTGLSINATRKRH